MILEIQSFLCHVTLEGHQEKTSLSLKSPTKSNYLYIIISYYSQPLFSKLNLLVTRKSETQNYIFYINVYKTLTHKVGDG